MAEVPYYQSSSYPDPSMGVEEKPDIDNSPQLPKKKKRNRKRESSFPQPSEEPRLFSSMQIDVPVPEVPPQQYRIDDDDDGTGNTPMQSQARDQEKRERKESRRAAKRSRQQVEAISAIPAPEETWEPSPLGMLNSQDFIQAAAQEPGEEADATKKNKRSYGGSVTGEQAETGIYGGAEVSSSQGISLNDLAEQLFSGRKKKSQRNIGQGEHNQAESSPAAGAIAHLDTEVGATQTGPVDGAPKDTMELYSDMDIDAGHEDNLPLDPALRADYDTNSYGPDASAVNSHDLAEAPVNTEEQTLPGIDRVAPSGYVDSTLGTEVVVPSSIPYTNASHASDSPGKQRDVKSTGRKRVAKPDFFSRVAEDTENANDVQSPTAAALSRKKGKEKENHVLEENTAVAPTPATDKASQAINRPLQDKAPMTTPTSLVRVRAPKPAVTLSGAFTSAEIQSLGEAIQRFRDDNGMTQYEVNDLIHRNPKEAKASELWNHIIATCPGRSRQKVINQTRRRFHNFVARGTWTPEQQEELKQMYELHGNKYSLIGTLINRHPEDIRDRIRNYLICGNSQRKDHWSQEETEQLVAIVHQAIEEIQKQRALHGIDDPRPVEEDINWQMVSQGMGRTRSRLQCMSKWKTIKPQLEGGGMDGELAPIEDIIEHARETAMTMSYRNRSFVIKAILKSGANADSRIPWLKVRNELNQQWTRPPLMVVWFRLKRSLPNYQSLNVKEICTMLLQNFQRTHKLDYPSDDSPELDYDAEYGEIEYRIKKARRAHAAKTPATVSASDEEDEDYGEEGPAISQQEQEEEEAIRSQLDATSERAAGEGSSSQQARPSSIDLGTGRVTGNGEAEIQDSEPETKARTRRRRGARRSNQHPAFPIDPRLEEFDDQSSDTNASQVSSIPARFG
ncbi:hypothetical protein GGS20DRAFT_552345 [Poronia punctata]|nr:hypothetical protein GGS20DRAFT_552345 [Poronia punctata]